MAAEPFTMDVEAGKVREFAKAVKSGNPANLGRDQPISPPTFLASCAFWQGPENGPALDAGLDLARVLHGGQEFVFHGPPPRAGTRLTGRSRIDRSYTKEGRRGGAMTFTEMVTEFRDEADVLVAEMRSTMIVTSQPPAEGA
ncbi:MAG: FAS1-like dehydratase domain-containing protein [Frankia sp.]